MVDFPFAGDADRENVFGAMLTLMMRGAIQGNVPLHLIVTSLKRVGKTSLARDVIVAAVTGQQDTPVEKLSPNDEEVRKTLITKMMANDPVALWDNLRESVIDSGSLAMVLTSRYSQDRLLGTNKAVKVENRLTMFATGNKVRASGEIAKRTVPIILQPENDAPEEKTKFKHKFLDAYVARQRPKVLGCLIGMVENWRQAGMPRGDLTFGSHQAWAETIGGVMRVAGFDHWAGNLREFRNDADEARAELRSFVGKWYDVHGTSPVLGSALIQIARSLEVCGEIISRDEEKTRHNFGKFLASHVDVPVARFVIRRANKSQPKKYRLEAPPTA